MCMCSPFSPSLFLCLFNSQCHLFKQTLLLYVRTRNEGKCGSNYGPAEWLTDPVPILRARELSSCLFVAAIFDRWCLLPRASIPFNSCVRRIFSCRSLPLSPHSAHALHQGAWLLLFVSYRMQCIRCADHRVAGSSRDPLWPPVPRFHLLPCFKYLSCLSRRAFIRAAVGQMEAGRTVVGTGR